MQILDVKNTRALENPALVAFLRTALAAFPYANGSSLEGVIEDVIFFIRDPGMHMLLGVEHGDFVSFAVVEEPRSKMFPFPTVFCFYNKGSSAGKHDMIQRILDIVKEMGYTRFRTANMSGHPDAAWLRVFKHPGIGFTRIGSAFEMTVE